MSLNLPAAVAAYFNAASDGSPKSVALCFAEDAVVRDEGRAMRGRAAIQAWNEETQKKYATVITPREATGSASQFSVTAQVAGTFPGSPLLLRFHFTLGESGISALEITA